MIGDTQLAFIISSAIMFACFLPAYYKLWKKFTVSRVRKIGYAILFPSLVILGAISTFVFQFFLDWGEVIIFNSIWGLLYLFLLLDLAGSDLSQKIPFGKILIAVGFTIFLIFCLLFILMDILNFASFGEWIYFLPLPVLIILIPITILIAFLAARFYRLGEEEFTGGEITSGGIMMLYIIVAVFAIVLIVFGFPFYGEDFWVPPHVQYPIFIIGIIVLCLMIPLLYRERQKRRKAGYGW